MTSKILSKKAKIIFVGDSGAGKTSLVNCLQGLTFQENSLTTVSPSTSLYYIDLGDEKTITAELWDTAGQERFHSLNRIFYKDAYMAILVYDVTKRGSFESIKNTWFKELSTYGGNGISKYINNIKIILIIIFSYSYWYGR